MKGSSVGTEIGCGFGIPPSAAEVGYSAMLEAAPGNQWRLTMTNNTRTAGLLNSSGIDLVALGSSSQIIGTTRYKNAGGAPISITPGHSWSVLITPTASACDAPYAGGSPPMPAGIYNFAATFEIGVAVYAASNTVRIRVGENGAYSAG